MSRFSHVDDSERYVRDVNSGKIPACKWVKLACERHVRDIASSSTKDYPYEFNAEKAQVACELLELLTHTKGEWAKTPIVLELWQKFIICSLFGWVKKSDGFRRFRKARLYVPRKNGKSIFDAAIGLLMLCMDDEPGAEVYCGATSEKQAYEVFKPARQMCLNDPRLVEACALTVNVSSILCANDGAKFEPVIGKPGDGSSPHCAIIDEFHEHKTSELIDTMETGMGARRQPLSLVTSTAGANPAGPCREDWKQCERILENTGGFEDETCFTIIFTVDQEDRWDSEEALIKANPNWGISVNPDYILAQMNVARQSARHQSAFKTKHLNMWVSARDGYFNVSEWAKLAQPEIKREDYAEFPCYIGADFATRRDLTSIMQLFVLPDNRYVLFGKHYLPAATIDLPENQHYRTWHIQNWLEIAGEESMDFDGVKEDIRKLCEDYQVEEINLDPTRMWGMLAQFESEGLPVVKYPQTTVMMSEPMKELDSLIMSGRIIHNGDPITSWAIGNVVSRANAKDNHFPRKENEANKIDPVVSTLFALGRAMTRDDSATGPHFSF